MFDQFGIDLSKFFTQFALFIVPPVWATFRVVRCRSGSAVPLWLLFIWLVPLIGSITALLSVSREEKQAE